MKLGICASVIPEPSLLGLQFANLIERPDTKLETQNGCSAANLFTLFRQVKLHHGKPNEGKIVGA